jgi:hypothetical protein
LENKIGQLLLGDKAETSSGAPAALRGACT